MTHSEKIKHLYQHLPELGISPLTAAPPLFHLFWRIGIEIPPPLFMSFSTLALIMGGLFAIGFGLFLWLLLPFHNTPYATSIPVVATMAGVLFGLAMATYYRHIIKRASLPSWLEYTGRSAAA